MPIPRGKEIDGPLLDMNYAGMETLMAEFKDDWKDCGVTIMCDSWTGEYLNLCRPILYCTIHIEAINLVHLALCFFFAMVLQVLP